MRLLYALCAFLILSLGTVTGSRDDPLIDWVVANWAEVHLELANLSGVRGAVASQALGKGDVIAQVPADLSIVLGSGTSAERAYELLEKSRQDPAFNATFGTYMAALPKEGELFMHYQYTDEDLEQLQTPELAKLIKEKRDEIEKVYAKRGPGSAELTLDELKHMAGVLTSRTFSSLLGASRLVPVLDMLNHSEEPNAEFKDDGDKLLLMQAIRPIAQGEELTCRYLNNVLQRSDASLFYYGYVQEQEQPLLCAVDLPTYSRTGMRDQTPASDPAPVPPASWAGAWLLRRQRARLAGLLAQMPTSEQEDQELLDSGRLAGLQQRMPVIFRLQRKRALRQAIERLDGALQAGQQQGGLKVLQSASELYQAVVYAAGLVMPTEVLVALVVLLASIGFMLLAKSSLESAFL